MLQNFRDISSFDGFVSGSGLIDIPLHGRKFTWYKPDGSCKSRIDTIVLGIKVKDFVSSKWQSYSIEGWGCYVVKEKFKCLTKDLKSWNRMVFSTIEKNIEKQSDVIQKLDLIDEVFGLEDYEVIRRNEAPALLFRELN
ncbi:hypothetical protein ACS0TY_015259 [Phlomoides rotata]